MDADLFKIASRVGTPLSIASLIVVVLYLLYKAIISLPIFEKLTEGNTFLLLNSVIDKVFILALVALVLGVGAYVYTHYLNKQGTSHKPKVELLDARIDTEVTKPVAKGSTLKRTKRVAPQEEHENDRNLHS